MACLYDTSESDVIVGELSAMQNPAFLRGAIYGMTAAGIWGSMYVVSDAVLTVIPPFTLLSLRIVLGLLVLAPIARLHGCSWPGWKGARSLLMVGMVGLGLSLGAQFVGTDLSTAVNGALITSASPAFVVLFAVIILRERLTFWRLFAIALATAGVLVILDPAAADFRSESFVGDLFLAIAAVTWGLYSVLVRRVAVQQALHTLTVTVMALLGGLLVAAPMSLIELSARPVGTVDAGVVLGVLYLGVVSTALALLLWNRAFALVPATVASLFFFVQPLSGALLAGLFLGQPMTLSLWLGGGLIAIAVLLSLWRRPT